MIKSELSIGQKFSKPVIFALLFATLSACDSKYTVDESGQPGLTPMSVKPVAELPAQAPVKAESVDVLLDGLRSRLEAEPDHKH